MKDSLNYLIKNDIEKELDNLIIEEIKLLHEYDGVICKKCKVMQGILYKGVPTYYCEHIVARVDRKKMKEKKEIFRKIVNFTVENSTLQIDC